MGTCHIVTIEIFNIPNKLSLISDRLVYELYALTEAEIKIVEESS